MFWLKIFRCLVKNKIIYNIMIFVATKWYLKVVGNEKKGGLRFLQLLGISLGPWRSMSTFILNVPFAIEKHISVSALSSKMKGDLFDKKRCGANKAFLLITRQFICARNVRSVNAVQTRKKSTILKLFHNLRCEFYPHRH
jgi:hypothetical protein